MKNMKLLLPVLFVAGGIGLNATSARAEIISNGGSFCHLKFPAIREDTLRSSSPVLKNSDTGDLIDFYGSCDHDPLGKEEIQSQRVELRRKMFREYGE